MLKKLLIKIVFKRQYWFILFFYFGIMTTNIFALPQFWTQEAQFSLGEAVSTQPDVCAYKENVFVVWSDNRIDENYELFFRTSSDGGLTWSIEERITETESDSIQPAIACGKNSIHLVWREKKAGLSTIFYSQWNDSFWSKPQQISINNQNNPRRPDIAITQTDVIYIVWEEDSNDGGNKAYFSYSNNMIFQRPQPITIGDWNTAEPRIAAGYRTAYVVWRDEREATTQIYMTQLGDTFLDYDIRLSSDGNCSRPSISVLEPKILVAYEARINESFPADVFIIESSDNGKTWERTNQLTETTAESIRPVVSVADDIAWVFWQDGESGNWKIHFSTKKGQIWSAPEKLRESANAESLQNIALSYPYNNPQFFLFWVDTFSHNSSKIFYSRRDTIPPKKPDTPLHIDENTKIGYDNDNTLTFSWIHETKSESEVSGYNIYVSKDYQNFEKIDTTVETIYNLTAENDKYYQIQVSAFDSVGNTSELSSASDVVYVDNVAPYVEFHLPRPYSLLTRPVPIIVSCSDLNLVSCRLKYGATIAPTVWHELGEPIRIGIDKEKILLWNNSNLQGVYSLALVAFDEAGNQSSIKIPVIVDNTSPLPILPGGKEIVPELDPESAYRAPSFSYDGSSICFSSNEGGTEDIWVYSISSQQRLQITQDTNIDFFPSWSPDSKWIVFQSFNQSQTAANNQPLNSDIWVIRTDGSNHHPLIQTESNETHPVFSPSGEQLAFTSDIDGDNEIWILNNAMEVLEGAEPQLFQLTRNNYSDTYPTWSPDETRIAFCTNRFGNWDVFELYVDGSEEKRLTDQFADETFPKYSPDGKQILYLSNSSGIYNSVMVKNILDLTQEPITLTMPGEDVSFADWSPDMKSIVYQSKNSIQFRSLDSPIEELQAVITTPYDGENLSGNIDIVGVAKGSNFVNYTLEYSELNSNQWNLIGGYSTSQVEFEDFLGRLDTNNLQGEYIIRLTVRGENNTSVQDNVKILVKSEYPDLFVKKPLDDIISRNEMIEVEGKTEKLATLTVNNANIEIDENGDFSTKVLLNEGENNIHIKAVNSFGLESHVERNVIRDTQKPEINISSPTDFILQKVPYVNISGQVNESAEVELIISKASDWNNQRLILPLSQNREFYYTISLDEGTNEIILKAKDQVGLETEVLRRVIYKPEETIRDINPPAITNVYPMNDVILDTNRIAVQAWLIDDREIDIDTLVFSFDGEQYIFDGDYEEYTEFDGEIFSFEPETGKFSYVPDFELADGEHNFTLDVMDEEENSADTVKVKFFIDTKPTFVSLSAYRGNNHLKVTLAANKYIDRILETTVYPTNMSHHLSDIGYSIDLNLEQEGSGDKPFIYAGNFYPVPTSKSFAFSTSILLNSEIYGEQRSETQELLGFYTKGEFYGDKLLLNIPEGPSVSIEVVNSSDIQSSINKLKSEIVLRSQDGTDLNKIAYQLKDAENRNLELTKVIYQLESSAQLEEKVKLELKLPNLDNSSHAAMFYWNDKLNNWNPIDARIDQQTGYFITSLTHNPTKESETQNGTLSNVFKSYTLLIDEQPPVIEKLFPKDGEDVPTERFLIEIFFHDEGSGIDSATLKIDGKLIDKESPNFIMEQDRSKLTYLPKNLKPGIHKLNVSVYDRAGNVSKQSSAFFTQEIFAFADEPICFPNPILYSQPNSDSETDSSRINIDFRLTQSADKISLEIYDIVGELIYKSEDSQNQSRFIWDCKNQHDKQVASGIYIYLLKASLGERHIYHKGKIAVIK